MARRKTTMSMDQRAALPLAKENPDIEYLRLNRQEICECEINSSIRLFLIDEDPISAHVLASAATAIMEAVGKGRSDVGLNSVREMLKSAEVPPDLENEVFAGLQHPYNFLKHSSSDLTVENDFSVDYIVMTVYSAAHSYKLLFEKTTAEIRVFNAIVQAWAALVVSRSEPRRQDHSRSANGATGSNTARILRDRSEISSARVGPRARLNENGRSASRRFLSDSLLIGRRGRDSRAKPGAVHHRPWAPLSFPRITSAAII